MKPLDDQELTTFLRKWEAPPAPSTLRVPHGIHRPSSPRSMLQWLWHGSIRVPAPVGVAVAIIVVIVGLRFPRGPEAPVRESPKAVAPFTGPVPVPDSNNVPAAEVKNSGPAAELPPPSPNLGPELAGFRPVRNVEPRIVGAMR